MFLVNIYCNWLAQLALLKRKLLWLTIDVEKLTLFDSNAASLSHTKSRASFQNSGTFKSFEISDQWSCQACLAQYAVDRMTEMINRIFVVENEKKKVARNTFVPLRRRLGSSYFVDACFASERKVNDLLIKRLHFSLPFFPHSIVEFSFTMLASTIDSYANIT